MTENYEDLLNSLDSLAEDGRVLEGRAAAAIRALLAERIQLLNTLQAADTVLGDPEHPRWDTQSGRARRRLSAAIKVITEDEDARIARLDEHDANIWDEGELAGKVNEHEHRPERKMLNPYRDRSHT